MIELEPRDALSGGGHGGLAEGSQLTSVDEGFQDVLSGIEVVLGDALEGFP